MTEPTSYDKILQLLQRVERRYLLTGIAEAALAAIGVLVGLYLLFGLVESFAWLSATVRTVLYFFTLAASSGTLVSLLFMRYIRRPDRDGLARFVEHRFPGLRERFISAVQLGGLDASQLRGQSPELVNALLRSMERETAALPVETAISPRRVFFLTRTVLGLVAAQLLLLVLLPGSLAGGFYRLADHSHAYIRPGAIVIRTTRGDTSIIRGDNFATPGFITGRGVPLTVFYRWRDSNTWNSRPVEVNPRTGTFKLTIEKPRLSFSWYLESGSSATARYTVTVIERPVVEKLRITLRYPAYTGLGEATRSDNDGNIRAPRGTTVLLEALANKPLAAMTIRWSDSTSAVCAVSGMGGKASFTVTRDIDYSISLRDTMGIGDINPILYRITSLEDAAPRIAILSPAADAALNRSMRLPLLYRAEDDYGLSRIALLFKLSNEENGRTLDIRKGKMPGETEDRYDWNLSDLNMLPGDTATYQLSAWDTDTVRGPKQGLSEKYTVRMPSMAELMQDAVAEQNAGMEKVREAREKSSEKDKALEGIRRGAVDGKKPDWNDKNAVEESKKQMEGMQKDVKDLSQSIKNTAEKLSAEDMAALETVEKLQKISRMMDELAEGDMKEALKKLTQAAREMDPRALKNALDQYQVSTEAIQKKLDNLLKLLDQVKSIQRYDMAKKAVEDMALKQADLARKYRDNPKDQSLAREQKVLASEMEKLQSELKDMAKELGEKFSLNTKSFDEYLKSSDISSGMKETAKNMEDGMRERAEKGQDSANSQLSEMTRKMDELGAAMQGTNSRDMKNRLLAATTQLLAISDTQEKVLGEFSRSSGETLAKRQLEIMESYRKAEQTVQALGAVSPELASAVDQLTAGTRATMKNAVDLLSAGNVKAGEQFARNSLSMLNNTVLMLTNLLKNNQSQGQGKGMAGDLMQQLQMIAEGQQSLQMQMGQGSQGLMQRLAAEQQKLSDMLSQLGQRAAQDQRLREMLEKISGDMDETAKMMQRNEPREKVERKQLDIYRRLLDARRSRQERDEENPERKSWTAKKNVSKGADRLADDLGQKKTELNERLKRAMQDDFDPEFKQLIRQYFESMLGDEKK